MAGHITAGTAILRITGAIQLDVSVGAAGHRITTTPLAAVRVAAHLDPHPVAVARLVEEAAGHLVVALAHRPHAHHLAEAPGHPEAALADQPHGRHLAVEAPAHPVVALAPHRPRAHRLVAAQQERQREADLAHPELAALARLDRAHHPVALALRVHHLAVAQPAQEAARAQAVEASSVAEAAAPVRVAASLVVAVVGAARVALEAADDDRPRFCNWRRLGFHHAA